MKDNNQTTKKVDEIVSKYLETHNSLENLFKVKSDSKEMVNFYHNNRDEIITIVGRVIKENNNMSYPESELFYNDYLAFFATDEYRENKSNLLTMLQKRMIVATMIYLLVQNDFSITDLPLDYEDLEKTKGQYWYRGQSHYEWELMPSMFRNLENVFNKPKQITLDTIQTIYRDSGMLEKWNQIFRMNNIDYNFLEYMQHSIEYSPLIDFTSDIKVALSFALGNKKAINEFSYKDAALFKVKIKEDKQNKKEDEQLNNFYINYFPESYIIGTPIFGKKINTFQNIIDELSPEYIVIDTPGNDRMKYQHGKFLFFYNYLSIKGTICTWLNKDLEVTKYRIEKAKKEDFCAHLRDNYSYLLIDKMMNPYSYWGDQ